MAGLLDFFWCSALSNHKIAESEITWVNEIADVEIAGLLDFFWCGSLSNHKIAESQNHLG